VGLVDRQPTFGALQMSAAVGVGQVYAGIMRGVVVLAVGAMTACGESSTSVDAPPFVSVDAQIQTGTGSVVGMVQGQPIQIMDAVSLNATGNDGSRRALIWMSTTYGVCGDLASNIARKFSSTIIMTLGDGNANPITAPSGPGVYAISVSTAGNFASWGTVRTDGACNTISSSTVKATSGSVTLTSVRGDVFAGTYDVMLDTGDHVTGAFAPGACPTLLVSSGLTPTCR
jgi:hypothetical protein